MSLFSSIASIGKSILKPVVSTIKTTGSALLGGMASTLFSSASGALGAGGSPSTTSPSAGGVVNTLPALRIGAPSGNLPLSMPTIQPGTPAPGGLARSIGAGLGQVLGAVAGGGGQV